MTWWQPPRPPPPQYPPAPAPDGMGVGEGAKGVAPHWEGPLAGPPSRRGRSEAGKGGVGTPGWDIGREWVLGTAPRDPAFGVGGEPMP